MVSTRAPGRTRVAVGVTMGATVVAVVLGWVVLGPTTAEGPGTRSGDPATDTPRTAAAPVTDTIGGDGGPGTPSGPAPRHRGPPTGPEGGPDAGRAAGRAAGGGHGGLPEGWDDGLVAPEGLDADRTRLYYDNLKASERRTADKLRLALETMEGTDDDRPGLVLDITVAEARLRILEDRLHGLGR